MAWPRFVIAVFDARGQRSCLRLWRVGGSTYIDQGWQEKA